MSFTERFLNAQATFLAALASGTSALAQFDIEWEILRGDFEQALDQSLLDADEVNTAYAVSSRVAILSDTMLELEKTSRDRTDELFSDMEATLATLTLEDVDSQDLITSRRNTVPYISEPYVWLTNNLHDPYPSTSLKRTWARNANVTIRIMNDWFKSLRKEIGWVALTQIHFNGSRSSAVKAAGAVFLDNGNDTAVPFEVQTELFAVQARLKNLYLEERGLAIGPLSPNSNNRPRSASTSSSASRSYSPSTQFGTSSDGSTVASSTSFRGSGLPSLVFDQSDSEEDERLPEFFAPDFLDDASIHIAGLAKDDEFSERRLKRTRHSYFDLSDEDSLPSWPVDPFAQLVDSQSFVSNDLLTRPDFWPTTATEDERLASWTEMFTLSDPVPRDFPTVELFSASPVLAPSGSRKRRHEDEDLEVQASASKKTRVMRDLPRPNAQKQQTATPAEPVVVANTSTFPVEQPIVINWEQFAQDFDKAQSQSDDGAFSLTGSAGGDDNVFDFSAIEPTASTDKAPVAIVDVPLSTVENLSWDKLFPTVAAAPEASTVKPISPVEDKTFEELLADLTNADALTDPLSSNNSEKTTVSSELPPELAFVFGTESTSDSSESEPSTSLTLSLGQTVEPKVSSASSTVDQIWGPPMSTPAITSPCFLELIDRFSSGDTSSFDCPPSPLTVISGSSGRARNA
ncbi:hypothetical protein BDY19DRAFT_1052215 [Irpex rosettiformis]|uniref:Uncharacterized protein n=1 Tax=Irpex rosettiformis TaxID=378272 RepID=A0ACB8UIY2_9APHY|nr:hypothetical protein BDY19DRAFT_1052215 [Irpex rosettiformis]